MDVARQLESAHVNQNNVNLDGRTTMILETMTNEEPRVAPSKTIVATIQFLTFYTNIDSDYYAPVRSSEKLPLRSRHESDLLQQHSTAEESSHTKSA